MEIEETTAIMIDQTSCIGWRTKTSEVAAGGLKQLNAEQNDLQE